MLVSVIIPCYNVEEYVEECIQSVLNQTYQQLEIICIDDGSDDNTLHILKKFKDNIIIISTSHQGANPARNKGVEIAKGKYLQFLDADDYLLPDKILSNISILEKSNHSQCILIGNYKQINTRNSKTTNIHYHQDKWHGLITVRLGCICSNLWCKSLVEKAGGWNEELTSSQDYDLLFRILIINPPLIYDPAFLSVTRIRKNSITTSAGLAHNEKRMKNAVNLRLRIERYLEENKLLTTAYQSAIHQEIFLRIKQLSMLDFEKAFYYKQYYLPLNFFPGLPGLSRFYLFNYYLWGYKIAERIAVVVNKMKGRNKFQ